jgi:hypothetical protein
MRKPNPILALIGLLAVYSIILVLSARQDRKRSQFCKELCDGYRNIESCNSVSIKCKNGVTAKFPGIINL